MIKVPSKKVILAEYYECNLYWKIQFLVLNMPKSEIGAHCVDDIVLQSPQEQVEAQLVQQLLR